MQPMSCTPLRDGGTPEYTPVAVDKYQIVRHSRVSQQQPACTPPHPPSDRCDVHGWKSRRLRDTRSARCHISTVWITAAWGCWVCLQEGRRRAPAAMLLATLAEEVAGQQPAKAYDMYSLALMRPLTELGAFASAYPSQLQPPRKGVLVRHS